MNRISLTFSARRLKQGAHTDIRLEIASMITESDPHGGRPHPYYAFTNVNGAGASILSVDLEPEEWKKVIGKLQKQIDQVKV
jgi:hypothetical protein